MIRAARKRTAPAAPTTRVAIYTRKSVTEGLDQEFNTLDAQREAVESYIASQRGLGWVALPTRYDDGGFTGAHTDRPAFRRLMVDIEAGEIDAVCVYRTDRLSRSLLDLAKLMELFKERGITFASVTEAIETSTPAGRMMLNMLASFAQYERETIAERTRDKMLAARRRGMWTGGRPVLGYDVVEKRLVVNETEAERVRAIFHIYLETGSLLAAGEELRERGWGNKKFTNKRGEQVGGRPFDKGSLHNLLQDPLYTGKVRAGDELHDGAHDTIVDERAWRAVQARLAMKAPQQRHRAGQNGRALLSGIARCACGAALVEHYTKKGQCRYRYYVCATHAKQGAKACPGSRVSAGKLERFVLDQIRSVGRDPKLLEAVLEAERLERDAERKSLGSEQRRAGIERARVAAERRKVADAVEQGGPAAETLRDRLAELDDTLAQAEQRSGEIAAELALLDADHVNPSKLRRALAELEPLWDELLPKERARLLALLLESVVLDAAHGDLAITFRPGGPEAVGTSPQDEEKRHEP